MMLSLLLRRVSSALTLSACRVPKPRPWAVSATRNLHATSRSLVKSFPPRLKPPPDSEIEESYLKGSGPGGQKINKTNSAVQLKHIPTGIVVKSQATRSRDQNRKIARDILAQRIDEHFNGDQSRTAQVAGIKRKKAASADKKKRRKYRQLEEGKNNKAENATEDPVEDDPDKTSIQSPENKPADVVVESKKTS